MRATMNPDIQCLRDHVPTSGTNLQCVLGIYFNNFLTGILLCNEACQKIETKQHLATPIKRCKRIPRVHFFDANLVIIFNIMFGNFVLKISTLIRNFLVKYSNLYSLIFSPFRFFNFLRKFFLKFRKFFLTLIQPAWIFDFKSVAVGKKRFASDINADRLICFLKYIFRNIIAGKTGEPFPVAFL